MVNFEPVDGPDSRYGQLHRPIGKSPFEASGLKGFTPLKFFKVNVHYVAVKTPFRWPTCQEIDDKMDPFPWRPGECEQIESQHPGEGTTQEAPVIHSTWYSGLPLPQLEPLSVIPSIPPIGTVTTGIIKSSDRIFLIADDVAPLCGG